MDSSVSSQSFSTSTNDNEIPHQVEHKRNAPDPPEDDPFQHLVCRPIQIETQDPIASQSDYPRTNEPLIQSVPTSNISHKHVIASHVPATTEDIPIATTQQVNLQQALQNIVIQREHKLSFMNFKKDDNYMSWKMMCIGEASMSSMYRHMVSTDGENNLIWDAGMGKDLERALFMATVKAFGTDIYKIAPRSLA
jgi:hypothetical protein